jgi:nucleotide-binding universal stress UspA family protein
MYRKMLVPLDGSKLAEETLPYVRELAGRLDLDLDFLYVGDPRMSQMTPMNQIYVDKMADSVRAQIQKIQNTTVGKETIRPIEVKSKLVTGNPADEILKYAEENKIDIIMMATHGASGVRRWALGSVAYQVLHASKIPVWLVRSGIPQETIYDKWPSRTIMVPLDGSKLAEAALPHAEAVAKQRGAQVIEVLLLCVYAPSQLLTGYFYQTNYPPIAPLNLTDYVKEENDRAKESCEKYLKEIADRLIAKGIRVRTQAVMGEAAEEIIKYANKNPFQLIVMASHGRSGLSHLAFGSVAEKVLLEANVPIFLVMPGAAPK